jgi:hypothetical protein
VNSPLHPVNLLALVLALVIQYYEEELEKKNPEENWGMSEKTPKYREEEQPPKKAQGSTTAEFSPEHMGVDVGVETTLFGERFP